MNEVAQLDGIGVGVKEKNIMKKISVHKTKIMYLVIKRLFDISFSFIGCLFLLPIALVVKIVYLLSGDFHPIFLKQERIGKNGKLFRFYKFRSMIPNADEALKRILETNEEFAKEYKINKKLENDPRVTKIGKILRKTSIDELPQLFNVLKGDMSLIGNRPYLPREKDDMKYYYKSIVKTKPGLTGYWQVNGRSDTTFKERLKLEKYYSNNCSLKLDIKIFFKTFKVVLLHKGSK